MLTNKSCLMHRDERSRLHAQTPYTIEVASAQYKELLNVYNANLYSNLTSDGTAAFTVVNAYQDVQPNYSNVVEITYTVFSKSQVPPAECLRGAV